MTRGRDIASGSAGLDGTALDRLMPLHLIVDASGNIVSAGPTLNKICAPRTLPGRPFHALFQVRRPSGIGDFAALRAHAGERLRLALAEPPHTQFRGVALPLADRAGMIVNLSFGIALADAVRDHALTDRDFAPTDLAVEMLYLLEAKTAVLAELRDLNRRLQQAKAAAEEAALTDTLTGLRNRRALDAALASLAGRGVPFGVAHLDLDHFKQVNDTFGHAAGDHVLQQVAQVLVAETRAGDVVARVGGDEFVILFPQLVDTGRIARIAQRIIDRLSRPIPFLDHLCRISASAGIAVSIPGRDHGPDAILAAADRALYAAKHAGRGRVTAQPV